MNDPSGWPVVYAIALLRDNVYIAGGFYYAGGRSVNHIARWDGSQWHPVGSGLNGGGAVALAVNGGNLYVGGGFDQPGGIQANKIGMWGCSKPACTTPGWSALATGTNDSVVALAASGGDVYVGGNFTTAGGLPSERFGTGANRGSRTYIGCAAVAATLMDGKGLAERIRGEIAEEVRGLGEIGLATVLVGDDPASDIYIRLKHKAAAEVGINARDIRLATQTTEEELLEQVAQLNEDRAIDGLLVQLPLPDHIDEPRVLRTIDPAKDVDGLHPLNFGQLALGRPTHVGATPVGVMALLDEYEVPVEGARAVVVGRSDIVGKPVSLLLLHANATVTICHSRTKDLSAVTREAEILVVAVGQAGVVGPGDVREGATVIDVGMNRGDEGIVGDVDPAVAEVAGLITPVPGGVGPMTIAMLLRNAVRAARYRRGLLAFPGG